MPGLHEVWVYRNDVIVAAGPIWDATPASDANSITVGAQSLEDYLDVRLVEGKSYNLIDQSNIAWDLIDVSQLKTNGNLFITKGTVGLGRTRSLGWRTYDNKYILEAINDLAALDDGFDWWIDPVNRQFRTSYPKLQADKGLTLSFLNNVRSYSVQYMGKYLRNEIRVQGADPSFVVATHPTSQTTYGLRQYGDAFKDAPTGTELSEYAGYLRDIRYAIKKYPTLTVDVDTIDVFNANILFFGDKVRVKIDDGYVQVDEQLRYNGCQVTVSPNGSEIATLYMEDLRKVA